MPIQITSPQLPPDVWNLMLQGLREMLTPYRHYVIGVSRIVEGGVPGDDLLAGWKCVTRLGPNLAISAIVSQDGAGRWSFGGLNISPQMVTALKAAEEIERRQDGLLDGDYEVAFLSVPGALTDCLWLRAKPPEADWIIPYDSPVGGLRMNTPYSVDDFLKLIVPESKRKQESPDPAKSQSSTR